MLLVGHMNQTNDDSSDWYNPRIQNRAVLGREVEFGSPTDVQADGMEPEEWRNRQIHLSESNTHDTHATTIAWTGCELRPTDGSCL